MQQERNQGLQHRQNALSVASGISLTASQQTLAMQMHLTALNAKSEPEPELAAEFARLFSGEPVEAIEFAFRECRESSPFFPAISDVRALIKRWRTERSEGERRELEQAEKAAIERARSEGKLVSFAECMQRLRERLKTVPEPEHERRERVFLLRVRSRGQQLQHAANAIPTLETGNSWKTTSENPNTEGEDK